MSAVGKKVEGLKCLSEAQRATWDCRVQLGRLHTAQGCGSYHDNVDLSICDKDIQADGGRESFPIAQRCCKDNDLP